MIDQTSGICDNFLYGFKGAPAARQPSGPPAGSGAASA
jgi:hypothetical protein